MSVRLLKGVVKNMGSRLIIGCRHCIDTLKKTQELTYDQNGVLRLPFAVDTAFYKDDLHILVLEDFVSCPFCELKLSISDSMLKFTSNFFDKQFHIKFDEHYAEISNGELSFSIPPDLQIESTEQFLAERGVQLEAPEGYLPTDKDLILIQNAMNDFDRSKWNIRLESGTAYEPYLPTDGLWFNLLGE